ncbi:MAG: hypothetical protein JW915_08620 [Chitinispirillaceae bacterium]|nr:hypothetical protein [Chitinispirillaceae bacterium]
MSKLKCKTVFLSIVLCFAALNAQMVQDSTIVSTDTTSEEVISQRNETQTNVSNAEEEEEDDDDDDELSLEEKQAWVQKFQLMEEKGYRLRRGGVIMIGGGICWLLGWSTILALLGADPNDQTTNDLLVLPIALGTTGFVCGGTAMLVKGKKLVRRGEQKQKELFISLLPAFNKISLMVEY